MTPQEFIRKWKPVALNERQTAQEHFLDLCRLFEHGTPAELDPSGKFFSFEKGVSKTGGGDGYADVWKKGYFAWEYKKRKRDLNEALKQITHYAAALESPPLHIACDTVRFRIETRFTNTVTSAHEFFLEDLGEPHNMQIMHAVFHDPEALRPKETRASLTRKAADRFQIVSDRLQNRNPDREAVAHFVNQLVFCFFANSVKLLPDGLLKKLLGVALAHPHRSAQYFDKLFEQMAIENGEFDLTEIAWFNGGLFDGRKAMRLDAEEIGILIQAASLEWGLIDPTIFGTLFERFLDPDKRAQIGAHYTDPDKIMLIVEPVIARPLRVEAETVRAQVEAIMKAVLDTKPKSTGRDAEKDHARKIDSAREKAEVIRDGFIDRLTCLRILDPACGSGNFLYLALQAVKDIEYRLIIDCETLGLRKVASQVGPEILHGIEINPFAAELARMTIWIGDIQWRIRNAVFQHPRPILRKLDSIECRDALLSKNDKGEWIEAHWPEVDFIVGNPPFLGGKLLRRELGDETVEGMFKVYDGRVPREGDLVIYWFVKAWENMRLGRVKRAGLVSTNSIRGGANRDALEPMADAQKIFEAWSDEAWIVDGAAVRVSIVCFADRLSPTAGVDDKRLDGADVSEINADLTAASADLSKALRLRENVGVAFMGDTKGGAFDIEGKLARAWLLEPLNANGLPNSDVLKPWVNGLDVTRRPRDMWIVDFGWTMSEAEAAYFEEPFKYIAEKVKPVRASNRRAAYRDNWWRHVEARSAMWAAIRKVKRFVVTPTVAKHRLFAWESGDTCADHQLIAIARDDDTTFGILHSRVHEAWSLRLCTWLGVGNDPRYTPTTTFETFPFPEGLTPNIPAANYASDPRAQRIAAAAKKLDELRNNWLNPPDLVDIEPEVYPTADMLAAGAAKIYPDRIVPKNADAAAKLRERTLTNLYNARPQWLANAHDDLDRAVAAAYGWPEDIHIDEALGKLLEINLARAAAQSAPAPKKESEDEEAD